MLDSNLLAQITQELRADEGVRAWPYDDRTGARVTSLPGGGNLTIGCGRNLFGAPLSQDEIDYLLSNDIKRAHLAAVSMFLAFDTWTQNRRAAIVNLLMNMGPSRFAKFHDTIAAIKAGNWNTVADDLEHSKWATQVQSSRRDRILKQIREG